MLKRYNLKIKSNRLLILLLTITICLAITFYIGLIRSQDVVYTQLFYIPVILAGMWYYRKAVYAAIFLSIVHILVTYLSPLVITIVNYERCAILIIVAYIIGIISEKQAEGEQALQRFSKELELKVEQRTKELEEKNKELERFNQLFVGREFRIKELKDKVKELSRRDPFGGGEE